MSGRQATEPRSPFMTLFSAWCELSRFADATENDADRDIPVRAGCDIERIMLAMAPASSVDMAAKAYVAMHVLDANKMINSPEQAGDFVNPWAASLMVEICQTYPEIAALVSRAEFART